MKSIGIGELRHAKKDSANKKQDQSRISVNQREVQSAQRIPDKSNENPAKKEGQLSVDIYQQENEMVIVCPIAGVKKSEINVSIQDDVLTIRGERIAVKELEDKKPLVKELYWGVFSRSIILPDHIDRKNISARVSNHMLIISIPKTEDFKTRIIHINSD